MTRVLRSGDFVSPVILLKAKDASFRLGGGCRIWSRDHVSLDGSDHVRDSIHRRARVPLMSWGGHLNLHVGGNGRRNHWLLVLMLVIALTLLRWLLLLLVMLLMLLRMRSDLRMGWGVRHCH